MINPLINIAVNAARAAGDIIMRGMARLDKVHVMKKQYNHFVTDIDQRAEEKIIEMIKKAYPNHSILGEESGESIGEEDYQWIIDPLDGTRNFVHGFPHFAVSIAVRHRDRIEHGVIYDPVRRELFVASRGKGAQLNEYRIRVSTQYHIEQSLLSVGFLSHHANVPVTIINGYLQVISQAGENSLSETKSIQMPIGDIRRGGAAALDLAYVASGRLDGFWELGLHLWDIAAGVLLVKEAGGMICDPWGGETYLQSGHIVAANMTLLRQLLKMIQLPAASISMPLL